MINQNRGGYFLLFFSLVLLMLFIPVWVGSIQTQIQTTDNIQSWLRFDKQNEILKNFLPFYLNENADKGPGYFKFGQEEVVSDDHLTDKDQQLATATGEDFKVAYNYAHASTIPVPTLLFSGNLYQSLYGLTSSPQTNILSNLGADCHTYSDPLDPNSPKHSGYPNCGFSYSPDLNRLTYNSDAAEAEPADNIKFFYTVPTLGTGNASREDCTPFKLNLTATYDYNDQTYPVDPLDHPCNWNTIKPNETVAIPLFTKVDAPDGEGLLIRYQKPEIISLRLRFPCLEVSNRAGNCHPEQRLELKIPDQMKQWSADYKPANLSEMDFLREIDNSPRLIDYALVDWNGANDEPIFYRPFTEMRLNSYLQQRTGGQNIYTKSFVKYRFDNNYSGLVEEGIQTSYEISQFKVRYTNPALNPMPAQEYLNVYDTNQRVSYFNFTGPNTSLVPAGVLLNRSAYAHNFVKYENLATAEGRGVPYYIFNPRDTGKQIYPTQETYPNYYTTINGEAVIRGPEGELPELYLVLRLENFGLMSEDISSGNEVPASRRINQVEWQVISDKPLGTDKARITGQSYYPGSGWLSNKNIFKYIKKPNSDMAPVDTGIIFIN